MKFCYTTNLIAGIICLLLEIAAIFATIGAGKLRTLDVPFLIGQLIGLSLFGIMGILLLVCAAKMKNIISRTRETELFLK